MCTVGFGNTEIAVQDENNIDYNEKDPLVLASIQTVPVTPTTSCTKYGAYFNSAIHLYKYIAPQFKNIDKALSGPQIIAVCMFISNTGGANFYQSKLCYTINNGNSQNYRETLSLYRSANNVRLEGLVTRRGLEGLIFGADNIPFISQLKPSIFGSPDIQYFQTKTNKRDYLQNEDGTFSPIDYSLVKQASEKFVATNIKGSILGILPPSKIDSAIQKLGIYIDKNGNFCNSSSPKNQTEIVKNNTSKMPLLFSKQKN